MRRHAHPLNALRVFETAARHLSFVKAAEELHVTSAAVSHQIKKLEDYLGIKLFRRSSSGLLLSDSAHALAFRLREIFLNLDTAIEDLKAINAQTTLTLSVAPIFAVKWLLPRLPRFNKLFPEIEMRISSSVDFIDFSDGLYDVAIRFGRGNYDGLEAVKMFEDFVSPMCSPRLRCSGHPLSEPDDLQHYVLLHDDSLLLASKEPDWSSWLAAVGATEVDASRGLHFGQCDHSVQAAIDGTGVVLALTYLSSSDVAAGRLVQPFGLSLPLKSSFYLVYPESNSDKSNIAIFRDWLLEEVSSSNQAEVADKELIWDI
jgi:LysR family glycine cleavage system transcriptional activator